MQDVFIRWPQVRAITGLSRSTVWRLESAGRFPRRRQLGANSVGWLEGEVEQWARSRPTFRSEEVVLGGQE